MENKTEKHSLVVMACTMCSRLLGIVRARVIASAFGSGALGDVINFTYNIPNNFRKLFAEGAMNSAFIPLFSQKIGEGKREEANTLMELLFSWQLLLFLFLEILSIVYGKWVIGAFSHFSSEQVLLGSHLLPFFTLFLITISLGTIFSGMLQVGGKFFSSSFAPLLFSITTISGIILFHHKLGAMSMAYSVALGGFIQLGYWYICLRRLGFHVRLRFRFSGSDFPLAIRHWALVMCSSLIQVVGQQVAYSLASLLEEGSVTAYSNATIFWQTPYGIFFTAISTVYFPLMSQSFSQNDKIGLQREVGKGLEYLATLLIPSSILLFFFSNQVVSCILQSGAFTLHATLQTAGVVKCYAVGMTIIAWYGFILRLCYSAGRYKLSLCITIIETLLDILLSFLGIHFGLGINSLPIAGIIAFTISLLIALIAIRGTYRIDKDTSLWRTIGKILQANIPVLCYCLLFQVLDFSYWKGGSSLSSFLLTALFGMIGVGVMLGSYAFFKISFLESFHPKKS